MNITFDIPKKQIIQQELSITIQGINILSTTDNPKDKIVSANIEIIAEYTQTQSIILFEGSTYDAIGQWTDIDIINRIKELYK